jgi:hypothetical protein
VSIKTQEYKAIFKEIKQSQLVTDDGVEIDRAMAAADKLATNDLIESTTTEDMDKIENSESADSSLSNEANVENNQTIIAAPIVIEPQVVGFIIREE